MAQFEKKKKKATMMCKISKGNWKCPNVSGENKLQLCEKHFQHHKQFLAKNPSLLSKKKSQLFGIDASFLNKLNKEMEKEKKTKKEEELPPDEQRCCASSGGSLWRCKNVRMWVDAAEEEDDASNVRKGKFCRQHQTSYVDKMDKYRKKRKMAAEDDRSLDETGIQLQAAITSDTTDPDTIIKGVSASVGKKRKNVKRTESSRKPKSLSKSREAVYETGNHSNCSKRRKMVTFVEETRIQPEPATDDTYDSDTIINGGSASIRTKRKNVQRTEGSREPVVELECLEHYKRKCIDLSVELGKKKEECTILKGKLVEVETRKGTATDETEHYKRKCFDLSLELGKKKEECTILQGKLVEVETKKATAIDETEHTPADATDCWRKTFPGLEMENSAVGCVESRISKLESLNQRIENEDLTMVGCLESRISNSDNLVLRSGKEKSILRCAVLDNTEKIRSLARGLHNDVTQSGESLGTEDSDSSTDSKSSLGDLMEMVAMKYRNLNKDKEIKWKSEADMLSSFEVDPELCMDAVCALYRQKIFEDETSAKGFLHCRDVVRVTTLAKFLMDGDCKGTPRKSVDELETFDSEAVEDCKMLAISYSEQLFRIYENRKDSYFHPTITDSHGDQTAK